MRAEGEGGGRIEGASALLLHFIILHAHLRVDADEGVAELGGRVNDVLAEDLGGERHGGERRARGRPRARWAATKATSESKHNTKRSMNEPNFLMKRKKSGRRAGNALRPIWQVWRQSADRTTAELLLLEAARTEQLDCRRRRRDA